MLQHLSKNDCCRILEIIFVDQLFFEGEMSIVHQEVFEQIIKLLITK